MNGSTFQPMTSAQHDQILRDCAEYADRVMHYHYEDRDPERYEHVCPGSE